MNPAENTAVKDPTWTGTPGEYAIVVGRGEPRRSNLQVQQAVYAQIGRYLAAHSDRLTVPVLLSLTCQLIAEDHIDPPGKQTVTLTREHLFAYLDTAAVKLTEAGGN